MSETGPGGRQPIVINLRMEGYQPPHAEPALEAQLARGTCLCGSESGGGSGGTCRCAEKAGSGGAFAEL